MKHECPAMKTYLGRHVKRYGLGGTKILVTVTVMVVLAAALGYTIGILPTDEPHATAITTTTVTTTVSSGAGAAVIETTSTITKNTTATVTVTSSTVLGINPWEVYFSPDGGAANHLIYWLDRSNKSVCAMIYSFTNDDIAAAFIRAQQRGVDIKISMDQQEHTVKGSEYQTLLNNSIPIRVDERSGLMHNKVAVIDGKVVITGSYNWSNAAEERNRENLIIIQDPALAATYQNNCEAVWNASTP